MAEALADSACLRYALAAAVADARGVITTMHTKPSFPLQRESATLACEAKNRPSLPSVFRAQTL
jgi:hypothetical protein